MATHKAALYTVQVRPKGTKDSGWVPFGDIDGKGANLGVALAGYMNGLEAANDDDTRTIQVNSLATDGPDLHVVVRHGRLGVAADLVAPDGRVKARQQPQDSQLVKCGALFRLPPASTIGWFAAHVNDGRSARKLLIDGLLEPFRDDFPDLVLEVKAAALSAAVRQAVDDDLVEKVKLVKLERANDRANQSTTKWVRGNADAKLELDITATRGAHLLPNLVKRYLGGDTKVFGEIVEFEGMQFDTAKVQVMLPTGRRTFNLEKPEAGHAITENLTGLRFRDGDPTDSSLFAAMKAVLP